MMRYYFLIISVCFYLPLEAQIEGNCRLTLSGKVIDEHDQSALSYANVYLLEPGRGAVADSLGFYALNDLCPGFYHVVVSHVSCEPDTVLIDLRRDTERNLFLEHHIEALQDIIIAGRNISVQTNSLAEQRLATSTLERYQSSTLGAALTELTGVATLSTGKTIAKPVIHGLYGSRVLIVNNGVRMQDMEWGDEHAPNVDINSASSISVLKGASALRFGGDAIGGVVVIDPPAIHQDTLFGKTSIQGNSNGRGGSVNTEIFLGGSDGWFGRVQGSVSRAGDLSSPDYSLTNTGLSQQGISVNAGREKAQQGFDFYYSYYRAKLGILRASHIGNIDDLVHAINSGTPLVTEDFSYDIGLPRQEVSHHLVRLKYRRKIGSQTEWSLQYDLQHNQRFEFDVRIGDDKDTPALDLELTTHTLSSNILLNQKGNIPLEGGLLYRFQKNVPNPGTGIRRLIPDFIRYDASGFLTAIYALSPRITLDGGVRYDFNRMEAKKFYRISRWTERNYHLDFGHLVLEELSTQLLVNPLFNYHNFSSTGGLLWQCADQSELRLNYTVAKRAPNPSELFSDGLHHSASRVELGDLRLDQETSHKVSVSNSGERKNLSWEVGGYINFINDFILLEPSGVEQSIRGAFPVWEYRQTNARLWGLDLHTMVRWHTQWDSFHSFSYIHGQDVTMDRPLINLPAPHLRNGIIFKYFPWHQLEIQLESRLIFKQTRFPDNNFTTYLPQSDTFEEVDISTPPGEYHLLNLRASAQFDFFPGTLLEAGISVENIANNSYRDYLNRYRYFADEPGRNFQISIKLSY